MFNLDARAGEITLITSRILAAFAQEMEARGHRVFRCRGDPPCEAVLWLEADDLETLEGLTLMRYSDTPEVDCKHCNAIMEVLG